MAQGAGLGGARVALEQTNESYQRMCVNMRRTSRKRTQMQPNGQHRGIVFMDM